MRIPRLQSEQLRHRGGSADIVAPLRPRTSKAIRELKHSDRALNKVIALGSRLCYSRVTSDRAGGVFGIPTRLIGRAKKAALQCIA
jgi:hypothetical protein